MLDAQPAKTTLLEVNNIEVIYNHVILVLKGVSLKVEEGGITADEQRFVTEQMRRPPDVEGLAAAVPNQEVGVQVYAAALMAITVDTASEQRFLARLADGVGLDRRVVGRLHAMVGAPAPA